MRCSCLVDVICERLLLLCRFLVSDFERTPHPTLISSYFGTHMLVFQSMPGRIREGSIALCTRVAVFMSRHRDSVRSHNRRHGQAARVPRLEGTIGVDYFFPWRCKVTNCCPIFGRDLDFRPTCWKCVVKNKTAAHSVKRKVLRRTRCALTRAVPPRRETYRATHTATQTCAWPCKPTANTGDPNSSTNVPRSTRNTVSSSSRTSPAASS